MAFFQELTYLDGDGAYIKSLDDKQIKGTHWVSLFIKRHFFWNSTYSSRSIT